MGFQRGYKSADGKNFLFVSFLSLPLSDPVYSKGLPQYLME